MYAADANLQEITVGLCRLRSCDLPLTLDLSACDLAPWANTTKIPRVPPCTHPFTFELSPACLSVADQSLVAGISESK